MEFTGGIITTGTCRIGFPRADVAFHRCTPFVELLTIISYEIKFVNQKGAGDVPLRMRSLWFWIGWWFEFFLNVSEDT